MSEWEIVTIEQLAAQTKSALATGPFGSAISSRFFRDSGVPVIRGSNLSLDVGQRLNEDDLVFVDEAKAAEFTRSVAVKGDLIFTCWGTIGQVGLIDDRSKYDRYIVSNKQMKLTVNRGIADLLFLYYSLSSPAAVAQIQGASIGSSVPGFNLTQLRSVAVSLPSLPMQRTIAGILGALDDKIALNERIADTAVELGDAQFGVALAKQTIEKCIGEVAVFHNRNRVPLSSRERSEFVGPYPYYGANGIVDHVADFKFDGDYVLVGEDGTVVSDNGSPVTQYARGKFWVNNHAHVLTGSKVSNEVLLSALKLADVRPYVTGAVQPKLSMGNLKKLHVLLPNESVLPTLERQLRELYSVIESKKAESRSLAELRDTLLPVLMSGSIRVRDAEKAVEDAT